MERQPTEKEIGREAFALYARAVVAFQSGEALLPLGLEKARAAMVLMSNLPSLTPEQQRIREELTEYMEKSGCL